MNVGLDIGTREFRVVYCLRDFVRGYRLSAAFAPLRDSDASRRLAAQLNLHFATCEGHLLLLGRAAQEAARNLQTPLVSLLPHGRVPRNDLLARQILATYLERLLPPAEGRDDLCAYTWPTAGIDHPFDEEFLSQLIRLRGYQPLPLLGSEALVLAEMAAEGYTGLAIDWGVTAGRFHLVRNGRTVASSVVPRGAGWIAEKFARRTQAWRWDSRGERWLDTDAAFLHPFRHGTLAAPVTPEEQIFSELCARLCAESLEQAARELEPAALKSRSMIVLSGGGLTQLPGFAELLSQRLADSPLGRIAATQSIAPYGPWTVARGCLIATELESQVQRRAAAA